MEKYSRKQRIEQKKRLRRKRHAKRTVKYVSALALSSFLANPTLPMFGPDGLLEIHRPMQAYAQESARLLQNTGGLTVSPTSLPADGTGPYNVNMNYTGTGVTNNAGGRRRVVFQSPQLTNNLQPQGTANVNATIRPLTLNNLPNLNSGLSGIIQSLGSGLSGIVSTVNAVQNNFLTRRLIRVSGLTELQNALNNLYNVDAAFRDIPAYNGNITPTVQPDGSIVVDFTDQINAHVAQHIQTRVTGLLTEVTRAINNLRIETLGGLASIPVTPVTAMLGPIASFIDQIATGGVNIQGDVSGIQPINQLTVTQNARIPRNYEIYGNATIYAAGTQNTTARPANMSTRGTQTISIPQTVPPFSVPAPTIDPINTYDTVITGTRRTDADTIITINGTTYTIPASAPYPGAVAQFELPLDGPLPAGTTVSAYQRDPYNRQTPTTTATVFEPPIVVNQPTIEPITAGTNPTITGERDPSAPLYAVVDGEVIELLPGDPNAEPGTTEPFEVELPATVTPDTAISFYQEDEFGRQTPETSGSVTLPPYDSPAPVVDPINDETTVITGQRNPRDPVIITDGAGNEIARLEGDPDADPTASVGFELPLDAPLTAGSEVNVYQEDPYGQQTPTTNVVVEEAPVPPAEPEREEVEELPPFTLTEPTIEAIDDEDLTITFTGDSGETLVIIIGDSEPISVTIGEDGTYTHALEDPLSEGTLIEAYQVDENERRTSSVYHYVTDASDDLPEVLAPEVNPVEAGDTTVTGSRNGPGIVYVVVDGEVIGQSEPGDGEFVVELDRPIAPGENAAYVVDEYGQTSDPTPIEVTMPEAPGEPVLNPVTSGDTTITGERRADTDLYVWVGESSNYVRLPRDPDAEPGSTIPFEIALGDFGLTPEELTPGTYIGADQVDQWGQDGPEAYITVDEAPPAPAYDLPSPSVNPLTSEQTTITGERNARDPLIIVGSDGNEIGRIEGDPSADPESRVPFEYTLDEPLAPGTTIEVYQTTEVDGEPLESPRVELTVTEPEPVEILPPVVNPITDQDTVITGEYDTSTPITINVDGEEIGTVDAVEGSEPGTRGPFEYEIPDGPLESGSSVVVEQVGADGETRTSEPVEVEEVTPEAPIINPILDTDDVIYIDRDVTQTIEIVIDGEVVETIPGEEDAEPGTRGPAEYAIPDGLAPGTTVEVRYQDYPEVSDSITVEETPEMTLPSPVIDPIIGGATTITGDRSLRDPLIVIIGDRTYTLEGDPDAPVGARGSFEIELDEPIEAGTVVEAYQTDEYNRQTDVTIVEAIDPDEEDEDWVLYPSPDVDAITTEDMQITGDRYGRDDLIILLDGEEIYRLPGNPDADPNYREEFSIDLTDMGFTEPFPEGTVLEFYQENEDGDQSEWTEKIVYTPDRLGEEEEPDYVAPEDPDDGPYGQETPITEETPIDDEALPDPYGDDPIDPYPYVQGNPQIDSISPNGATGMKNDGSYVYAVVDGVIVGESPANYDYDNPGEYNEVSFEMEFRTEVGRGQVVEFYQVDGFGRTSESVFVVVPEEGTTPLAPEDVYEDTAPPAPSVNGNITENTLQVPVTRTPGNYLYVVANGVVVQYLPPTDDEEEDPVPLFQRFPAGTELEFYQVTPYGVRGEGTTVTVEAANPLEREYDFDLEAPDVDPIDVDDEVITGIRQPDADLYVYIVADGRLVAIIPRDPDAPDEFELNIDDLDLDMEPGKVLEFYQIDQYNRRGESTYVVIGGEEAVDYSYEPLPAPEVDPISDGSRVVSGTRNTAGELYVVVDGEVVSISPRRVLADQDDIDPTDVPFNLLFERPFTAGTVIEFYQIDEYGRRSPSTFKTVELQDYDEEVLDPITPPEVNPISSEDTEITGSRTGSSSIFARVDGEIIGYLHGNPNNPDEEDFSIPIDSLPAGTIVEIYKEDEYGRRSESVFITVDEELTEEEFELLPPIINPITSEDTTITGEKQDNTDAYIVDTTTGEVIAHIPADPDGTGQNVEFEVEIDEPLAPGTVAEGYQVDNDGRRSESEFVVVDEADYEDEMEETELLPNPDVNEFGSTDQVVTGTRIPNAPLYAVVDGEVVGILPPDSDSEEPASFEFDLGRTFPPGTVVEFYQVDEFGRPGGSTYVPIERPAFNLEQLTVDPIASDATTITGQRDPSVPVYAEIDGEIVELIPADPDATPGTLVPFEVEAPEGLEPGTVIRFYQEDEFGRPSQSVYVRVDEAETTPEEPFEVQPPVINPITSEDTTITGEKQDNTDLIIVDNTTGEEIGYVPADPDGTGANVDFEVELPMPLQPGTVVEGYQVDEDGRRGESEFVIVEEEDFEDEMEEAELLPGPEVNPFTSSDTSITGTRVPNAPLYAVVDGEVVGVLPPDSDSGDPSAFEWDLGRNFPPGTVIEFYQIDNFGRPGSSTFVTVTADEEEPPVFDLPSPQVDPIDSEATTITGTRRGDSPLYIVVDGEIVGVIQPDPNAEPGESGTFEWTIDTPLAPGTVVEFYQEDPYGRRGQSTFVTVDVADVDPETPFEVTPPVINPITSEDTTITGEKRDDTDLYLVDPNTGEVIGHVPPVESPVGENVEFEVDIPEPLAPGTTVEGYEVDQDGRRGESEFVVVDEGTPDVDDQIENVVPPLSAIVDPITSEDTTIRGERDPSAPIYIVVDGEVVGYLPADPDAEPGTREPFEYELPVPLPPGTEIVFYPVDQFGQPGEETRVVVQVPAPGVNTIREDDEVITVERDPNYPVVVIVDGEEVARIPAEPGGSTIIEIPIDPLPAGTEVVVHQEDDNGNPSVPTTIEVQPATDVDPDPSEDGTPDTPEIDSGAEEGSDTIVVIVNPRDTTVVIVDGEIVAIIPGDPNADPNERIRLEIELDEPLREGAEIEIYQISEDGVQGPSQHITVTDEVEEYEDESDGIRLPRTATEIWTVGLAGFITLLTGIGAKLFGRDKKDDED